MIFKTAKGSSVELAIVTETVNLGDRNVTNACYELVLTVNGNHIHGGCERINDTQHGASLKARFGGAIISIPADKVLEVDALIAQYRDEIGARAAASRQADAAYGADYAAIQHMMQE